MSEVEENIVSSYPRAYHKNYADASETSDLWEVIIRSAIVICLIFITYVSASSFLFQPFLYYARTAQWTRFLIRPSLIWGIMGSLFLIFRTLLWFWYKTFPPANINDAPYINIYMEDRKVSQYFKDYQRTIAKMDQYKYLNIDTISSYFSEPNGTIHKERDTTIIHPTINKLRFNGKVCVLIGPKCFSYANEFAIMVKYHRFATLIGEPLEENQDGYASTCRILLPRTKFIFRTSTTYFPALDINNTSPIRPDIFVNQSLEDVEKNKDSVLDYAKKWIMDDRFNK